MKTVVANWKMNGSKKLVDSFKAESENFENFDCEVVLCPPFIYLEKFIKSKKFSRYISYKP